MTVLGNRALNRATLARQLLLDHADMPVLDAVAHLCGLQAQEPQEPFTGLWSRLRAFDLAYRVGGEEFLVLLPGAGVDEAHTLADALRDAVVGELVAGLPLTVSFGVAATGGGPFEGEMLLAEADAALYVAKERGRDRVVVA